MSRPFMCCIGGEVPLQYTNAVNIYAGYVASYRRSVRAQPATLHSKYLGNTNTCEAEMFPQRQQQSMLSFMQMLLALGIMCWCVLRCSIQSTAHLFGILPDALSGRDSAI